MKAGAHDHDGAARSYWVAFYAAKAAFIFKDGRGGTDYERALPDLVSYYRAIRGVAESDWQSIDAPSSAVLGLSLAHGKSIDQLDPQ
jgi:hypothetical protein